MLNPLRDTIRAATVSSIRLTNCYRIGTHALIPVFHILANTFAVTDEFLKFVADLFVRLIDDGWFVYSKF